MVTTTADLNLHPDLNGNVKIFCSQYDNALREIVFTIYDGDDLADLTDLTATVEGTKPDKYGYSYDATVDTSTSTVTVTLVTQMTCVAGLSHAEIVLYSDDYRVGTANFLLMVEEAGISDDTIVSDSVIPGIHDIDTLVEYAQTYADNAEASALEAEGYACGTQDGTDVESGSTYYHNNAKYYCEHAYSATPDGYDDLVTQVETNTTNISTNTTNISELTDAVSDTYDSSTTYAVGDHFIYENVIYTVTAEATGITPPNSSYYTSTTITELIEENASDISSLNSNCALKTQISNQNLIDNPWFTVNQRGESSYSNVNYTVDRWKFTYAASTRTVTVYDGYITIANSSSATTYFQQVIENDLSDKEITLSIDCEIESGSIEMYVIDSNSNKVCDLTISSTDRDIYYATGTLTGSISQINIAVAAGASVKVYVVKLEVGSASTLAMDAPPNYATELLKCQRYFIRYLVPAGRQKPIGFGYASSSTDIRCSIVLPCAMRTTPTITISDVTTLRVTGNAESLVPSALSVSVIENNIINLDATVSDATANQLYLLCDVTADEYIDFSADL